LPGRARKEARTGTALWPEAAVAGIAWARLAARQLDQALTAALAVWAAIIVFLTLYAPHGSLNFPPLAAFAFGLAMKWEAHRQQTYQRIEAHLIEPATACLPDDGQPVVLVAARGFRERLGYAGATMAVGAALAYGNRGSVLTEAILIPVCLLAAAFFASPFRRDDTVVRLDADGLRLAGRRATVPWRLIDRVDLIDIDGRPRLRWIADDPAFGDLTVGLATVRGGAEDAVLATRRYTRRPVTALDPEMVE
jgi:hypothetical protein